MSKWGLCALAGVVACGSATSALAQTADQPAGAAPALPPPAMPAQSAPLTVNPRPFAFEAGAAGKIYVTGVLSGLAQAQSDPVPGDHAALADLDNAQLFIQKTDGVVQFFVEGGEYSIPALGAPYAFAAKTPGATYGLIPQAYLKIAPTSAFSIQAGKLPTLIGAEYTFSFENMNVGRGLLWNQENAVNRGVQANYAIGPAALSASLNDGFYSNRLDWATASLTYSITPADAVVFSGGGAVRRTRYSSSATPQALDNESIADVIYTHSQGPWTIEPYLQYTAAPKGEAIGAARGGSTLGEALLVSYSFPPPPFLSGVSLPVRLEHIASSGDPADGAPNLIYGPGSSAWSATLTPTFQFRRLFLRAEVSWVQAVHAGRGLAFGAAGDGRTQARAMLETGVLF